MNEVNYKTDSKTLRRLIVSFLMPTLIGKSFILYFGLNYSEYPGEGFGYGLAAAAAFTVFMLFRLLWQYRGKQEF